eukprot:3681151-Rhodomonas_salina.3
MGLIHPPAGACATIYISGNKQIKNLGWMFFVAPVLLDCFVSFPTEQHIATIQPNLPLHSVGPSFGFVYIVCFNSGSNHPALSTVDDLPIAFDQQLVANKKISAVLVMLRRCCTRRRSARKQ